MESSVSIQPGVIAAIWLSVVQRKVGTTLRRSTTFHWNSVTTVAMTRNPRITAIQSSVRHRRATATGALTSPTWVVLTTSVMGWLLGGGSEVGQIERLFHERAIWATN